MRRRRALRHEDAVLVLALLAVAIPAVIALPLLWLGDFDLKSRVQDDGHGVDTTNLFVPFFTTKPTGSGIGLVLARQIAEAHGGSLALRNRRVGRGAEAVITLPASSCTLAA